MEELLRRVHSLLREGLRQASFSVPKCFLCMWCLASLQASRDPERKQFKKTYQHNEKGRLDRWRRGSAVESSTLSLIAEHLLPPGRM